MRKSNWLILSFFIIILVFSCSLKRENPLDPNNNEMEIPDEVIVHSFDPYTSYDVVRLRWELQPNIAVSYYLYRSMSYNGSYLRIAEVYPLVSDTLGIYDDYDEELISGNWYYYRVSAVTETGLEGYRSFPPVYTYYLDGSSAKSQ
ncbi:MAG: hypothetical protein JW996_06685 [Candidatus Cloacimonetes bacterium]|nr:hypothetical protein [Candidatus Cloacimonadota bacterium]